MGPRRPPIQLGLALAPALTCCLSLRGQPKPRIPIAAIQRPHTGRVVLLDSSGQK